eukprot:TRINITY_DN10462_c0_g1_i1.p1 TRINITY_DN10462_c0_g1~~TRINITY_DN10462_c0_g1_i1.p1  ORF type:complete len:429 (+),score=59.90 TRINITY_DN10462_c0_g1_i1:192-1478(+)
MFARKIFRHILLYKRASSNISLPSASHSSSEVPRKKPGKPARAIDVSEMRVFFDTVGKDLKIDSPEDWYQVNRRYLLSRGARTYFRRHENSMIKCIMSAYPEHKWKTWKFNAVPKGFWDSAEHQRAFMDSLATHLNIAKMDDWYKLTKKDITDHGGRGLLDLFQSSPRRLLAHVFPAHDWKLWRFSNGGRSGWTDPSSRRAFFDWAQKELQLQSLDGWYAVPADLLRTLGGSRLLSGAKTRKALAMALSQAYPEHKWDLQRFLLRGDETLPADALSQRAWFDSAAAQLFPTTSKAPLLDMWYSATMADVERLPGSAFITHMYQGQLSKAIVACFPEHSWEEWKFQKVPGGFWRKAANQRRFLLALAKQKFGENNRDMERWYEFTQKDVQEFGGTRLIQMFDNSVAALLRKSFPEHTWVDAKFKHRQNL